MYLAPVVRAAALLLVAQFTPAALPAQRLFTGSLPTQSVESRSSRAWGSEVPGAQIVIPASAGVRRALVVFTGAIEVSPDETQPGDPHFGGAIRIVEAASRRVVAQAPIRIIHGQANGEQVFIPVTLQGIFDRGSAGGESRFVLELYTRGGTLMRLFHGRGAQAESDSGTGTFTAIGF